MTTGYTPVLQVRNLCIDVRRRDQMMRVVDGVSFDVAAGRTLGLVGESGCGKTLTAMSLMRLEPGGVVVSGGRATLGGEDILAAAPRRLRQLRGATIAAVFQDPLQSLNPTMTIGHQLTEVIRHHKRLSRAGASETAVDLLRRVRVGDPRIRMKAYPHQLSGGLRQRCVIALALAGGPQVLIADEPTTALDVTIQAQILDLLEDLQDELGMAIILITHDLGVIASRADEIAVMYAGRIVEHCSAGNLFTASRHPYTRALLSTAPGPAVARRSMLPTIPGTPPEPGLIPSGCAFHPRCSRRVPSCATAVPEPLEHEPRHSYACFNPVAPADSARVS
jgi:oligopeptide/dipeptide ABC transporter ATP-binding protein